MDKLLPCPFCGSEAGIAKGRERFVRIYAIQCTGCQMGSRFASTKKEGLIDQWNTRHTPEGWQLVPVEATSEMASYMEYPTQQWRSILTAAPKWGGE